MDSRETKGEIKDARESDRDRQMAGEKKDRRQDNIERMGEIDSLASKCSERRDSNSLEEELVSR